MARSGYATTALRAMPKPANKQQYPICQREQGSSKGIAMSARSYSYRWCYICGKNISTSGGGVHHFRMHVREGKMVEVKGRYRDGETWVRYDPAPDVELVFEYKPKRNSNEQQET